MKIKIDNRKFLAIFFVFFIIIGGVLTLISSPRQIFGGIVRGYIDSPEDCNTFQKVGNSLREFDNRSSEYFIFHDISIHAYGGIQKLLNRSLIDDTDKSNQVLKLNNGYLTFKENKNSDLSGLQQYLVDLKKTCDSTGSKLLYVKKTTKNTTNKELLPCYYPYVYNLNFDEIKPILEKQDILVLDIDEKINKSNIDKYSLFFKTDHHWLPQTGIWVSKSICEELNNINGWNLDTNKLDINNYNIITYPNSFLGSQGKRIGAIYGGIDDFYVVYPSFETKLTVDMSDIEFNVTGNFQETLLNEDSITPNNLLNKDNTAYNTYMRGNHDLVKITNHNMQDGKKALLVLDSFGCVVAPYLSLEFSQLDCIDIRSYTDSVKDYIEETKPDVVIYAIDAYPTEQ